jgi:glycosyltransferase involved in cell wall biosynthesis
MKKLEVSDRVKILVDVKREQLRSILLSSKVYFHPKVGEHFGISIIEGMASGCIPIVHNSGGPKELVPSNQRFNDMAEAAELVGRIIDNWSPVQSRIFFKLAEPFSENNFSKQFVSIFDKYLRESSIMKK